MKATGKLSLDAIKDGAATHLSENVAAVKQLGKSVWHGFAHGVERAAADCCTPGHGDIDLKLAVGKASKEFVHHHTIGAAERDLNTGRELFQKAHIAFEGQHT